MKKASLVAVFVATFISTVALSQESPHKGEEARPIKALSPEDVEGYLDARGMGFGKVAELNHYPGPKHVLELADELELTDAQKAGAQAAFDAMRTSALELGNALVDKERELDGLFARGEADESRAEALIAEIARIQGALRFAHVRAHVAMRAILTSEQIERYDRLRGYAD